MVKTSTETQKVQPSSCSKIIRLGLRLLLIVAIIVIHHKFCNVFSWFEHVYKFKYNVSSLPSEIGLCRKLHTLNIDHNPLRPPYSDALEEGS